MAVIINQLLCFRAPSSAARRCCKWLDDNEISSSDIPLFTGFAHCVRTSDRTSCFPDFVAGAPPPRPFLDLLSRCAPFHIPVPLAGAALATKEGRS